MVSENLLNQELAHWEMIYKVLEKYQPKDYEESKLILFGIDNEDDIDLIMK